MKPWWRVLVVLAFVLPVGGYVVGSLVATSVDDPAPRAPMQIAPAADGEADATGSTGSTAPEPSGAPSPGPTTGPGTVPSTGATDEPIPVRPRLGDDRGGPPAGDDDGDDDGDDGDDGDDDDAGDDDD